MKSGMRIAMQVLITVAIFAVVSQTAHATFPGKNGRIAFIQGPDIYTMNPDGTNLHMHVTRISKTSFCRRLWRAGQRPGQDLNLRPTA